MFKKRRIIIFLWLVLLPLWTWAAQQKLTVMLDWFINPDHAPLLVAQEQGFFAKHGLDVKLIEPSDAADPPRFAAIGKVDLALTYEPQWLLQRQQGLPLAWVATLVNQPLSVIILDSKQANSITELKNKTIGYSESAISSAFLGAVLQQTGTPSKAVSLMNVHYDLIQALLAHRVAAISGAMGNVEPVELAAKQFPFKVIVPQQFGVPSYAELIFVTQQGHEHDPRFKAFTAALQEAVAYLKKHPEQAWQQFAKAHPALNTETNHRIWLASVAYFADAPAVFDVKRDEQLKRFLQKQKVLH